MQLPQHVLRFWETRFNQIKPMKRGGGRRYYRPEDVDLLRGVRLLLYGEGFTIRGVQRLLKEKGVGFVVAVGQTGSVQTVTAADREDDEEFPPPRAAGRREPVMDMPDADPAEITEAHWLTAAELPPADEEPRAMETPRVIATPPPRPALSLEKRRRIESALSELLEAKRVLEQVRQPAG